MAKVEVGKRRTTVNTLSQGIEVIIPTKRNYSLIVFMAFWLMGWAFGEVFAIESLLDPESEAPQLFLIVWLGAWTVGGAFAISVWLYNVNGKEILRIDGVELKQIKDFILFKRTNEYELANIKDLRVTTNNSSAYSNFNSMEYWGITGGTIAFDYGYSTHKIGSGLDEAEAKHIVQAVKKRYKNL